jgi:hypothetical protein
MARKVTMVVRFCKVIMCFQGLSSFNDFIESSKGRDERDNQEEKEVETQYYFTDNFIT